jgi:hypothetical protein
MNEKNIIRVSYFQVGSIVRVTGPAGLENCLAYVYENYDRPGLSGISLITEDGRDLGGYNLEEQANYLEYFGDTGQVYHFTNVSQLAADFQKYIQPLFSQIKTPRK